MAQFTVMAPIWVLILPPSISTKAPNRWSVPTAQLPLVDRSARERVVAEIHENTYDAAKDSLTWTVARGKAHATIGGVLPVSF